MVKTIINANNVNKRLDIFLTKQYPETSRSQWQKRIKAGEVLVNDTEKAVHYFLKEGDEISISNKQLTINKELNGAGNQKNWDIDFVYEDKDYLIINKPAGLVVHPDDKYTENTLVDYILKKYPEVGKVGEYPDRPGIVHRLDKEVSGLMVVARTQDMFDCLKKQFKTREINKEYMALVYGRMKKDEDRIDLAIARSKTTGIFVARHKQSAGPEFKRAVTEFEVVKRFQNFTLVKLKILTGRTHQIRVHLKSVGHSVVGDKLYVTHDIRLKRKQVDLGRIFLHASLLGFKDLNDEYQEFKSDLPQKLSDFLVGLR